MKDEKNKLWNQNHNSKPKKNRNKENIIIKQRLVLLFHKREET